MSNKIKITRTQFTDTHTKELTVSHGYRIHDDSDSVCYIYPNGIKAPSNDTELLRCIFSQVDDRFIITDYARMVGVTIDETFYEPESVMNMINQTYEELPIVVYES